MACKTKIIKSCIDKEIASYYFNKYKDEIKWHDGIRSRNGFTRKAYMVDSENDIELHLELLQMVQTCIQKMTKTKYFIRGIYLNYYEDGNMYTPSHTHPGSHQLVISLGGKRTLTLGKKNIEMENGDAIIFGSTTHGVPKEKNTEPRISIATFMTPIE